PTAQPPMRVLYRLPYGRSRFGSARPVARMPTFLFSLGPSSLSSAVPSRLVGSTRPEQVDVPGTKSQSDQLRVSLCSTRGSYPFTKSVVYARLYLLTLPFTAVFASPVKS